MGRGPVVLASIAIGKEFIFCNAITNAQCERTLRWNQRKILRVILAVWRQRSNKFLFALSVNVPLKLPYNRTSTAEGIIKVKGKKPITSGFTCNFSMLINYGCFVNSWSLSTAAINITGSDVAHTNSLLSVSNILMFLWVVD